MTGGCWQSLHHDYRSKNFRYRVQLLHWQWRKLRFWVTRNFAAIASRTDYKNEFTWFCWTCVINDGCYQTWKACCVEIKPELTLCLVSNRRFLKVPLNLLKGEIRLSRSWMLTQMICRLVYKQQTQSQSKRWEKQTENLENWGPSYLLLSSHYFFCLCYISRNN